MKVKEQSIKQVSQQTNKTGLKKLGLRELVKVEARVRSGCTKSEVDPGVRTDLMAV